MTLFHIGSKTEYVPAEESFTGREQLYRRLSDNVDFDKAIALSARLTQRHENWDFFVQPEPYSGQIFIVGARSASFLGLLKAQDAKPEKLAG